MRPYSIYDYDEVWRSTRQVLIFGSVSTVLLSVLYETVTRRYVGNTNDFGTILIMRTGSTAVILLVLATISIVYHCLHEGYETLLLFVADLFGVVFVSMSIFNWLAFSFRRFVQKQIITRFVEDGSWRYSQLYFSQYKQAFDEFHRAIDQGGLSDETRKKYKSAGPTDKIVRDRFVQEWIFAATPNPKNPTAPLSNGTLSTSLHPKVPIRGHAPILVCPPCVSCMNAKPDPTLNCSCLFFATVLLVRQGAAAFRRGRPGFCAAVVGAHGLSDNG